MALMFRPFAVLGAPFPMVLMARTILLVPLPFGGTALIRGPVAGYLLWSGSVGKGLVRLCRSIATNTSCRLPRRPLIPDPR